MRIKGLQHVGRWPILAAVNMILIQPDDLHGNRALLADERALHVRSVLDSRPGDRLRIGLLNGPHGVGRVESVSDRDVVLLCDFENDVPARPCVDLLLAMPRPKVMKRLWAQLAALGVGRIVVLRADKVERFYFDSHVLEPDFYNARLIEGLQQARCTHLPEVFVRPLFKPFVEDELDGLFPDALRLLADPSGERNLRSRMNERRSGQRILLAVGPEGGWTPYELDRLEEHGFQKFGLGVRILRTDTATIALLAVVHDMLLCTDA